MQSFIKDLYVDEFRDGFFVTTYRKKLWNVQIQLILEVDRICQKHNIRWFADGGTLLGAARHKGFIPWDDDVDLGMLRPDYDKFVQVAPSELKPNYFLDNWCDYRLEEEADFDSGSEEFPLLSTAAVETIRNKHWWWPINAGFIKIRDSSTTMIQWSSRKNVNQGIWIDIFPYDAVPPFATEQEQLNFEIGKELIWAARNRPGVFKWIEAKKKLFISVERLLEIVKLPYRERALLYEKHMAENFSKPLNVNWIHSFRRRKRSMSAAIFNETIQLPFEQIMINVPGGYEDELTYYYGDWHKPVVSKSHSRNWSADISYKDYFRLKTV